MRYQSTYSSPPFQSPFHQRWHRLLFVFLAASLFIVAVLAVMLYARFELGHGSNSAGSSPQPQLLSTRQGQTYHVTVLGRSADVVKVTSPEDGAVFYLPLSNLSAADRAQVASLPINLTLQYPLDTVLTDLRSRTLHVLILGRTADQVRFTRVDTQKTYTYNIAKLSVPDQDLVRALPLTPVPVVAPAAPATIVATSAPAPLVTKMQELAAELLQPPDVAAATPTATSAEDAKVSAELSTLLKTISQTQSTPGATAEAQAAQFTHLNAQIAQVSSDLEKTLSGNNSINDQVISQQLAAAQNQLQLLYNQANTTPASK